MFCPKCGKENANEAIFCEGCGFHLKAAMTNTSAQKSVEQKPKKKGCLGFVVVIAIITVIAVVAAMVIAGFVIFNLMNDKTEVVSYTEAATAEEIVEVEFEEVTYAIEATEEEKTLESLTYNERKKLNTFLSNFSEVQMFSYESGMVAEGFELIRFAYLHNSINNTGNAADGKISAESVNKTLEKYFGITIADDTYGVGDVAWVYDNGMYTYDHGDYYFEDPLNFTLATALTDEGNGLYSVEFLVYQIDEYDAAFLDKSIYGYSVDSVKSKYTGFGEGVAKIREKAGSNTYELVEYQLNTYY